MKKLPIIGLIFLLLGPVITHADENQKIAVASIGKTEKAPVCHQAARSPYYIVFDGMGRLTEVVDNPYKNVSGGAGPSVAHFLVQRGVSMVIAGNFGPKIIHALEGNKVTYFQFEGTVGDAVQKALKGRL